MDFRKIITKMRDLDPTTPGQDLEHYHIITGGINRYLARC